MTGRVRPAVPSGHAAAASNPLETFALDVNYYLSQQPRQLPSRYLYDALGSCLFEAICRLPWYPITRAETRLLAAHAGEIFAAAGAGARIVELGCGSGEKLATLVSGRRSSDSLELHLIDVSPTALGVSMRALSAFDHVHVVAHEASYETGLVEIKRTPAERERTLMLFLGSNIGNFDPPGAHEFLHEIRAALRPGDLVLIGVDLVKPERILQLAYDDPLGVTAAFNRNLLVRINRELGGNFSLPSFAHRACWNAAESRVEMHLVCLEHQRVHINAADLDLTLEDGETIWTESSYKYDPAAITTLVEHAGLAPAAQWVDPHDRFALTLCAVR
jgi:dimethylhistidine N-methyltransferase